VIKNLPPINRALLIAWMSAEWEREVKEELGRVRAKYGGTPLTLEQLQEAKPEQLGNDMAVEAHWAETAGLHAETYWSLLTSRKPGAAPLKLTKHDDELYFAFRGFFPESEFPVDVLDLGLLKSEEAKGRWREYIDKNASLVRDFNFGTLVRIDAARGYSPENSDIVTRIQFYAIEIARHKEGHNEELKED